MKKIMKYGMAFAGKMHGIYKVKKRMRETGDQR